MALPATMEQVSYIETKRYLQDMGLNTRLVHAPTKFHLKEYAERSGVDLTPLISSKQAAIAAASKAEAEAEAARLEAQVAKEAEAAASASAAAAAVKAAEEEAAARAAEENAAARAEAEAQAARQAEQAVENLKAQQEAVASAEEDLEARKDAEEAARQAEEAALKAQKERERARIEAEEAAAAEAAARAAAEAAAVKAAKEAETRRVAEEEAAAQAEREAQAAAERERAEQERILAERALVEQNATRTIQTHLRAHMQRKVYYKAWKSVLTLQTLHRGRVIKAIARQLLTAANLLKAGNIFLKFSKDGPPHDRLVWITEDLRTLLWCNPNKNRTHDLKPEARMDLTDISAMTEGIKTEVFKAAVKTRESGKTKMSLRQALRKEDSQVLRKGDELSELCCFSILSSTNTRTIDLVAPSNRVRDDWLWGLRLLTVHMNTKSSLAHLANQKRIAGEIKTNAGVFTAQQILSTHYDNLEFTVQRGKMGLGILMDSATNQIVELEEEGSAFNSGLKMRDVVVSVNNIVCTSIVDGMIEPRQPEARQSTL
eukprot:CAMPEP_0119314904 /NCGR_PEP_ID=MMETSP1333-20130426/34091_1 /TAXON_ID=418940 /ORGANISM="Scyphosphaera apsteinii, Strain RCC1455" /LENGTH=544 /DNA_ID=CAMNT_0007320105 /DNA_START=9 /DNA_END=1644 /DNA_ORIENTATION=+